MVNQNNMSVTAVAAAAAAGNSSSTTPPFPEKIEKSIANSAPLVHHVSQVSLTESFGGVSSSASSSSSSSTTPTNAVTSSVSTLPSGGRINGEGSTPLPAIKGSGNTATTNSSHHHPQHHHHRGHHHRSLATSKRSESPYGVPMTAPSLPVPAAAAAHICPKKLASIRTIPRNKSPFDPRVYHPLLPPSASLHHGRPLLAIDLDETLVHAKIAPILLIDDDVVSLKHTSPKKRKTSTTPTGTTSVLPPLGGSGNQKYGQNENGTTTTSTLPNYDTEKYGTNFDFVLDLSHMSDGQQREVVLVRYRPFLQQFIEFVCERFEVVVFTASHKSYADPLLNALDPHRKLGHLRLYREHCADVGGTKVKDLSLLGRPLHRIALLDNTPTSYLFQPRNGIAVTSWYDDPNDKELMNLMPLLESVATARDVVEVLDLHSSRLLHD